MVPAAWRALIGHMLTVDKHLIPFTGADRYNYNFIISGKPKGGTYQIRTDYAAFLGSTTSTMAISTGQNGTDCLKDSDRSHVGAFSRILDLKGFECSILIHKRL